MPAVTYDVHSAAALLGLGVSPLRGVCPCYCPLRFTPPPAHVWCPQVGKLLGEEWKALSAEDKAPYEAQAAKDKERYAAAMAEYKASGAAAAAAEGEEAGGGGEEEAAE